MSLLFERDGDGLLVRPVGLGALGVAEDILMNKNGVSIWF